MKIIIFENNSNFHLIKIKRFLLKETFLFFYIIRTHCMILHNVSAYLMFCGAPAGRRAGSGRKIWVEAFG
jgi:hypothetical protein